MNSTILVVDDDPVQRRLLEAAVQRLGYGVLTADNGETALAILSDTTGRKISAMILDLVMPGKDGISVLRDAEERGVSVPTIVQTAQGSIDVAISAMRAGAFDFVVKPVAPERLRKSLEDALKVAEVRGKSHEDHAHLAGAPVLTRRTMIAGSEDMARVRQLIDRAAASDIPVLIEGESGTGKELVARAIQEASSRASKPLVVVNCGAIPENLVESILFGHEKGAFTGATEKHLGKFVEANGGTLFLDEIGELPLAAQVKLLRAIQESEVEPVGARVSRKVNIRVISATNRDLIAAVREGRFREDLYYRLNVFPIMVPPLRNRRSDIPALVGHFIASHRQDNPSLSASSISDDALKLLISYDWPGNIRQLENAVFRAMVLSSGDKLDVRDFPQIEAQMQPQPAQMHRPAPLRDEDRQIPRQETFETRVVEAAQADPANIVHDNAAPAPSAAEAFVGKDGHVRPLTEIEAEAISHAIAHYGGQMSEVARRLGIGRSTLYRKLKDYDIEPDVLTG